MHMCGIDENSNLVTFTHVLGFIGVHARDESGLSAVHRALSCDFHRDVGTVAESFDCDDTRVDLCASGHRVCTVVRGRALDASAIGSKS